MGGLRRSAPRVTAVRTVRRAPRRPALGVVIATIPLALLACGGSPAATGNVPSASLGASEEVATVAPSGSTLFDTSGTSDQTTATFHASGASVEVSWSYDCSAASGGEGTFALYFYGAEGSPALADELTNGFGAGGSDTASEALNGNTGPFHLEIQSACSWKVKVVGVP